MDWAREGHRLAISRVLALADLPSAAARSGDGWTAVRTGAASNDLNAVISEPGLVPPVALLGELRDWWDGVPASWLVESPSSRLTQALVVAGWSPERTGRWCGQSSGWFAHAPGEVSVDIVSGSGVDEWLDIADGCGWFEDERDRDVRRSLLQAASGDDRQRLWLARLDDRPVGMARGGRGDGVTEVVDVAVVESARRQGVGTALVAAVILWGGDTGVIAAPSPDGWRLFESLGFDNVPVVPDVCFYWSGVG